MYVPNVSDSYMLIIDPSCCKKVIRHTFVRITQHTIIFRVIKVISVCCILKYTEMHFSYPRDIVDINHGLVVPCHGPNMAWHASARSEFILYYNGTSDNVSFISLIKLSGLPDWWSYNDSSFSFLSFSFGAASYKNIMHACLYKRNPTTINH